jgi:hypothetical protein
MALKLPVKQPGQPGRLFAHQKYGSIEDPVHKSHISSLIGQFACTESFRRDRERELIGEERQTCSGKTEMGTAAHACIARALRHPEVRAQLLDGFVPFSKLSMTNVLLEEYQKAIAGRDVIWYGKSSYQDSVDSLTQMLTGLFANLHKHVAGVELVEAGWIAPIGKHWTEGHVDLIYRPRSQPDALAYTDWKTGDTKPHQIELDHGFESGLYSNALQAGLFLPTEVLEDWRALAKGDAAASAQVPLDMHDVIALSHVESERAAMHIALRGLARRSERGEPLAKGVVTFGRFPEVVRLTHLADYELYQRAGKKKIERPEELEHWGLSGPDEVKYVAGQQKGPAWYRVRRTADDVARLEKRLRTIVGWVRMGLFVDAVGEKCTRCSYRGPCLTSGYELRGDAAKDLDNALKGVDLTGLDGLGEV